MMETWKRKVIKQNKRDEEKRKEKIKGKTIGGIII